MPKQSQLNNNVRRGHPLVMVIITIVALISTSTPISVPAISQWGHNRMINSEDYKKKFGYWETVELPEEFRLNTIHAAALPTGRILLVAGSGNVRTNFDAYHDNGDIKVLKSVVFDPISKSVKNIPTPADFFCSGHALLQSGSLLIAGGTSGYERLDGITNPAGVMTLHNEDPDSEPKLFKKGTVFKSKDGKRYRSVQDVTLKPADKIDHGEGNVMIHASSARVFVESVDAGSQYVTSANQQYAIEGLSGSDVQNIYGQGGPMTFDKQDFRGDNVSYEFDPGKEEYVETGKLNESRWYPTLPVMQDGTVLAVSGLDNTGQITTTTERYNPATKQWTWGKDHAFPSYPALFRTNHPDILFFSGSSAGYGPADKGREPGFWNTATDEFKPVKGLRYTDILETSASVVLPPTKGSNDGSQSNRVMLAGGGGIGESPLVTSRTDIIDLMALNPRYTPGPDLPVPLRYLNLTVTPWDEVFATGGTADYRSKGNSYSFSSFSINPTTNSISQMAEAAVGRGYHSGSLLLRDGRIMTFGNDPLFSDKADTTSGKFEQRLEIYTPPQFFTGRAPVLDGAELLQAKRGQTLNFSSIDAGFIHTARLIPPSSATHVTNIEQRSIAAVVTAKGNSLDIALPTDDKLLPNGWYMLFAVDSDGRPSVAKMVEIIN